ncbi:hypothetical protein K1X76_02185 [bacterium]|nr:hypothetical protein [bacterium]
MLHIKFTSKPFDKLTSSSAVLTLFSDKKPLPGCAALVDWRLNGRLSKMIVKNRFVAEPGEILLLPTEGRLKAKEIMVFGMGPSYEFNESHISHFTQFLLGTLSRKKVSDFMVSYSDMIVDRFEWRNSVRLLVSKLHDFPGFESVNLCESEDCVRDAKKRHMDFGMNVDVSFDAVVL